MDLSAAAGPAVEERQEDDQEDGRTGRRTEGGEGWGGRGRVGLGTSPAGALAHLPFCHTKGDTIRVGLKHGGFFFSRLRGLPGGRCVGWEGRRGERKVE